MYAYMKGKLCSSEKNGKKDEVLNVISQRILHRNVSLNSLKKRVRLTDTSIG